MRSGRQGDRVGRCGDLAGLTPELVARAYRGRRVLVTGHTGFKGSWLTLWLGSIGAHVSGLALAPVRPSMFADAAVDELVRHAEGDVRDADAVAAAVDRSDPDAVIHLAAQSLVGDGYARPAETFSTNVLGTVHVLDALRRRGKPCAVVIVTSDKCYLPAEDGHPHHEEDPLGGEDPYSASKAACEMAVAAYRASFFPPDRLSDHGMAIATARAGNVIGGGDWAADRIVPDAIRALASGRPVVLRNPTHVRPWQHVLEPLAGYLALGARMLGADPSGDAASACAAWNLAPPLGRDRSVRELTEMVIAAWGSGEWVHEPRPGALPERASLRLDPSKAERMLGWRSRWDVDESVRRTVVWYRDHAAGLRGRDLRDLSLAQIADYMR